MNLKPLQPTIVVPKIMPLEHKIVVVGLFATGKSTLTAAITKDNPDYRIFKTDDFLQYEQNLQMRFLLNTIWLEKPRKYIVEGAAAYRLLRSGLKYNNFHPNLVINCVCSDGERQRRYCLPERWNPGRHSKANKSGMKDFKAFDNQYRSMWEEYKSAIEGQLRKPRIVEYCSE